MNRPDHFMRGSFTLRCHRLVDDRRSAIDQWSLDDGTTPHPQTISPPVTVTITIGGNAVQGVVLDGLNKPNVFTPETIDPRIVDKLRGFVTSGEPKLVLNVRYDVGEAGRVIRASDPDRIPVAPDRVIVILRRDASGQPFIVTAYPERTP